MSEYWAEGLLKPILSFIRLHFLYTDKCCELCRRADGA